MGKLAIAAKIMEEIKDFFGSNEDRLAAENKLLQLEIEEFSQKKGIITRAFHLIFPILTAELGVMYAINFWLRVDTYLKTGKYVVVSLVPSGLEIIVIIFLSLLMPRKLLEPLFKLVIKYLEDKLEFEKDKRKKL